MNLFMMQSYAVDGYLMAKMTPSTDIADNGDDCHASGRVSAVAAVQGWSIPERRRTSLAEDQGEP